MIFVDASVFMYAAGRESPRRQPCQRFLTELLAAQAREKACTTAEVLQEILHRYCAIGVPETGFRLFDTIVAVGLSILPVTEDDMRRARVLLAAHPNLSTRDAVHAGVMQGRSIRRIATYDRGFSPVAWIQRVEP